MTVVDEQSFEECKREKSNGMMVNSWIDPLGVVYILHMQLKSTTPGTESRKGRVYRKLLIPAHFTLLKLHEAITKSFQSDEKVSSSFYAFDKGKNGKDKTVSITGYDLSSPGFNRTVEDVFGQYACVYHDMSNGQSCKITVKSKSFLNLDTPHCKSGKGLATTEVVDKKSNRIPKKAINEDLSHVTQVKEFVWV